MPPFGSAEHSPLTRHHPDRGRLHARLRAATAALHRRVEDQLDLLGPGFTLASYRCTLATLLGFYEPLEERIASAAAVHAAPSGFELVARVPALRDDLAALAVPQAEIAALARCRDLPVLRDAADLAGCLYVVEGAALGGRVISGEVARRLGITAETGGSFFAGEGPRTALRWKAVLGWIESLGGETRDAAIVEAARETFRSLERWLLLRGGHA